MGYETTLVFVRSHGNDNFKKGYMTLEATLELNKCMGGNGNALHDLLESHMVSDARQKKLETMIKKLESMNPFNEDGEYDQEFCEDMTEEQKNKCSDKYFEFQRKIEKAFPYFYGIDGNIQNFADSYGDALIIVSLNELKEALQIENAKSIAIHGSTNGWYSVAIKLVEAFEGEKENEIRVVLFGH